MHSQHKVGLSTILCLGLLVFLLPACTPDPCSTAFLVLNINNANATPATADTINLAPGCIYELDTVDNTIDGNNGLPSITSPIIINGNGATIRRGLNAQKMALRLFHVSPNGNLTLNDVTLLDGLGMNPPDITLPIVNNGGGIYNAGQLLVQDSVLDSNRAITGGGIYNAPSGTMKVESTSFINNQANIDDFYLEQGGGINNAGQATIVDSTLTGNYAWQFGGAIENTGTLKISNSTISGNSTAMVGGAAIHGNGDLSMEYSTIAYNSGGSSAAVLVANTLSTVEIGNSIIADNSSGDCGFLAPITTLIGGNLDSDASCVGFSITASPMLDPLANNGGPTDTHALQAGSPALDAALGSCPAADQRGQPRPGGSACDLGAYEDAGGAPPTATPTLTVFPTPTSTPTATMTPTPATLVCTYTAAVNANCRASDYSESDLIAILLQGEMAELMALNPEFTHGKFELQSLEQCWIWLGLMDGPGNPWGECGVPVVDPRPPSPTPTPVCNRDLDQRTCIARGGKWVEGAAAAPYCECP